MTLPRAILLDLDDTILNDTGMVVECWREACFAHASGLHPLRPESLLDAIERTRDWYWADAERHKRGRLDPPAARAEVVHLALQNLGVENPVAAAGIAAHYADLRNRGIQAIEGAIETIHWLRGRGCRTALITNGNAEGQREKVARFDLEPLFEIVLIEGELGFGKPDPRVYKRALEHLDLEPRDTWMVGDNLEWDVEAPQRLGIRGVWIDKRGTGVPSGRPTRPDQIIRSLAELRLD
jgi:putative hydrolase of the HAD superfamily